ncbi:MAG: hypothetical protein WD342_12395 [Verrucomicrobiales bacterium]
MAAISFRGQYDRPAYLRSRIHGRWETLSRRGEAGSDAQRLAAIEAAGESLSRATDEEILGRAMVLRRSVQDEGLSLSDAVEEGFALVREASRRTTGLFHYGEQVLAGLSLVRGGVAEMATGEGKTLAVSLPAFIFSLRGKGVHVVTVNSYLAERDFEFTRPIFEFLGVRAGLVPEGASASGEAKKEAYACDVTYGVGYEYGFDYMRDQLRRMRHPFTGPGEALRYAILGRDKPEPEVCQRGLEYAIVDEVDSVLIDEAGSPLLISEAARPDASSSKPFFAARRMALKMVEGEHFTLDRNRRRIDLSSDGRREIFEHDEEIPWELLRRPWEAYVINALKAEYLFHRDDHYVVEEDKVVIVDEFTGRRFADRSWREGQHQAVETKEGVEVRPEADSAASITRQRFYALYGTVCGLTGTAAESAGEFWRFFRMPVVAVPLHKPSRRVVLPERIFIDHASMDRAIAEDVAARHAADQPVLVGTRTIRDSERLSALLEAAEIPHRVLTAKQDAEEEEIVSTAGREGSVLIATNMAGRGTHIDLSERAEAAGGLHVVAVERNESARIDRQLAGRGARQGQPGAAQSFVSADDYLLEVYAPEIREQLLAAEPDERGELPGHWKRLFDKVQSEVERLRYRMRLRMAERDEWLEETKESLAK